MDNVFYYLNTIIYMLLRRPKGQMYIIATVFLAAMIFSIQGLLLAYSEVELSGFDQLSEAYIIENNIDIFQSAVDSSNDCNEAKRNVEDLKRIVNTDIKGAYDVKVSGSIDCEPSGAWPSGPDLTLKISVIRESGESNAVVDLFRGGAESPSIYIYPENQTVSTGGTVTVDVMVSNVLSLYGYQFDIIYDPAILTFNVIEKGDFLAAGGVEVFWINVTSDDEAYSINNTAAVRQGPVKGWSGGGVLATITFDADNTGTSQIELNNIILTDPLGNTMTYLEEGGAINVE